MSNPTDDYDARHAALTREFHAVLYPGRDYYADDANGKAAARAAMLHLEKIGVTRPVVTRGREVAVSAVLIQPPLSVSVMGGGRATSVNSAYGYPAESFGADLQHTIASLIDAERESAAAESLRAAAERAGKAMALWDKRHWTLDLVRDAILGAGVVK
jgi:hypothetical protein